MHHRYVYEFETENIKPCNLYELLDHIRVNSGLYIGINSISRLRDNINGFTLAFWVHGIDQNMTPRWEGFNDFVAMQLSYNESTSGWTNMIL